MRRKNAITVPPLLIFALTAVPPLLLGRYFPLELIPSDWPASAYIGRAICISAGGLALWAFLIMRRERTTVNPYKVASRIVSDGPFGISRHPLYLSLLLLYPGLSLILNSAWMLLAGAVFLVFMQKAVITREEDALKEKFGAEYEEYMRKVRRWL